MNDLFLIEHRSDMDRQENHSTINLISQYRYSNSSLCLISLSEEFLLIFEEQSSFVILCDHRFNDLWSKKCSMNIVDLCYSSSFKCFFLLNEKQIFRFDPIQKDFSSVDNYQLVKSSRLMSSICSTTDSKIYILYRFGEYLDVYPQNPNKIKIWKRKHFCQSFEEDVFLIRSSHHENPVEVRFALLIVEFNEIWRVDIYSSRFHRLTEGFRFTQWNRQTYLNEHFSADQFIWSVDHQNQLFIDQIGQPSTKHRFIYPDQWIQCRSIRLSNRKYLILFRDKHSFKLYQQIFFSSN